MSLNIGTLVGYLQLDDKNFERKADAADRKINALKLHLAALAKENPQISVEVDAQTAQLDELKLKLADLKAQAENGVDVRVDAVQALIEIDRVQTKIRELHGKTIDVKVDVDKSQLAEGTSLLDKFGGSLSALPALAIAAGSALVPLIGVVGGLAAAIAAPLAIAGGGTALFALLGGAAITQTEAEAKKIATLKKSVDAAQVSLDTARRTAGKNASTSTSVANAQERLNKATQAYRSELALLGPSQKGFLTALQGLKDTFTKILNGPTGKALLQPFTDGLTLASYVLTALGPVLRASAHAFDDLLSSLQQAVNDPAFEQWVHRLAHQVGPDIVAFGHIIGNLVGGLGGLLGVLDGSHFSGSVLTDLERLTHSFDQWGNSRAARHDVRELFAYVHRVGPQVGSTLGAIAHAAGHLVAALAPLGPPVLKVVEGIAKAISKIPVPVLTALAGAFIAITAASKVASGVGAIGKTLGTITSLGGLVGGGGIGGKFLGGVQKVYVVNLPPGGGIGGGGGGILGDAERGGKFAPLAGLAGLAPELGVLGLGAFIDYQGGKHAYNSVRESASRYAFGQALPTMGGPPSNVDPKTRAAVLRQQNQLFWQDGGGHAALQATTTAFDALRARTADASRQIDMIGPHAAAAFGAADREVDTFRSKLAAIQDKKLAVILQDQAAVQALEALQNLRLHDKTMTVTIYQQRERGVGPGGGIGHHAIGGWIFGPGTGMSDSIPSMLSNGEFVVRAAQAAANAPLLQAINNGSGRVSLASAGVTRGGYHAGAQMPGTVILKLDDGTAFRAHIEGIASDVNSADRGYYAAVGRK